MFRTILLLITGSVFGVAPINVNGDDTTQPVGKTDLCVILIGGIDSDPSPEQMSGLAPRGEGQSGLFQLANDLRNEGLSAEYFNWNGTRAGKIKEKPPRAKGIAQYIIERRSEHPQDALAIVANSWGGHTAWEVCQELEEPSIPVETLVLLDPSSAARAKAHRPKELPLCVKSATNYYTRNVFGWRAWPDEPRLSNIDLGDERQGFLVDGGPRYNSNLDIQAHIAAEWDPRIHGAITTHLVDVKKRAGEAAKRR